MMSFTHSFGTIAIVVPTGGVERPRGVVRISERGSGMP